jgi:hypothetical protein
MVGKVSERVLLREGTVCLRFISLSMGSVNDRCKANRWNCRPGEDRQWHETDELAGCVTYQPEKLLHVSAYAGYFAVL